MSARGQRGPRSEAVAAQTVADIESRSQTSWIANRHLCRLLVTVLALACYANSTHGEFLFDDSKAILGNPDVNPDTPLSEVFLNDFWGTRIAHKNSHKSYRPLTVISFRWNHWFAGGLHPIGFHLTNIVLHAVVSLVYLELCYLLFDDSATKGEKKAVSRRDQRGRRKEMKGCAIIAAGLFAVHPIHSESVAGVVGRAELLSALCFFIALFTYAKACQKGGPVLVTVSVLLGAMAMLCKEQGATVMGVCVVYELVVYMKVDPVTLLKSSPKQWKGLPFPSNGSLLRLTVMVSSSLLLLFVRYRIMVTGAPSFQPIDNPAAFADSLLTRILTYNYLYSLNAWLLLCPQWLCFDWSMGCVGLVHSVTDPRTLAVCVLWTVMGSLGVYAVVGTPGRFKRLVLFSLSLLLVPFLPASNLLFRVGFVIAERVLYLPSAGYCLLIALGIWTLAQRRDGRISLKILTVAFIAVMAVFVGGSIQRSAEWCTEESLFTSGVAVCPRNAKVHYNLGKVEADNGRVKEAEMEYREAIRLYPEYDQALNNLGNLLKDSDRLIEAEVMFQRALKANSDFATAWMNQGIVLAALNKSKEAEQSYYTAIQHRNNYPDAYYNLGNLYIDIGRPDEAITAFKSAISLKRDHTVSWTNLGLLLEKRGRLEDAEEVLREALTIFPEDPHFHYSLGVLLGKMNQLVEAEQLLLRAIEMNPTAAVYHANLGVIYHLASHYSEAENSYQMALSLNPQLAIARDNLNKLHRARKSKPK